MSLVEKRKELVARSANHRALVKEKYGGVAADIANVIIRGLNKRVDSGYREIVVAIDYADHTNGHYFWNWLLRREDEISIADMKSIWKLVRCNLREAGFKISYGTPLVGSGLAYTGLKMKKIDRIIIRYDLVLGVSIEDVKPKRLLYKLK